MNPAYIRQRWREGCILAWRPYKAPKISVDASVRPPAITKSASSKHQLKTAPISAKSAPPPEAVKVPAPVPAPVPTPVSTPVSTPVPQPPKPPQIKMAAPTSIEQDLQSTIRQLHACLQSHNYTQADNLLSRARVALLRLNVLTPLPQSSPSPQHLLLAREVLELGALISIWLKEPESFTRYFQQLQSLYALPPSRLPRQGTNASKITGLYLLLLLSQGDYAGFHTLLETLVMATSLGSSDGSSKPLEDDEFIQYPVRLEQALMEGSYDRIWGETKGERVPSEEFSVFAEVRSRPRSYLLSTLSKPC